MRGIVCRGLRLELVAGLAVVLAMPALSAVAQGAATETVLTVDALDPDGRAPATVTVTGEDGLPATGAVAIVENGVQIAGAALNAEGRATLTLALAAGDHSLRALYVGNAAHRPSSSLTAMARVDATTTPSFQVSVAPATLSLTAGQSGTIVASVTPENSSSLTGPMFVTLSCSGLPDQSACTFTPENIEILPNATAAVTSSMVIVTQTAAGPAAMNRRSSPVAWAFLLPGVLGLGGLGWALRRNAWLNRFALLALVALVAMLGATACAPRYDYYNHGPPLPPATPSGAYTITVTAQSSNGVSAITNSTTLALTVQ